VIKRFEENALLSEYCTYRIGGRVRLLINVFDLEGLMRALEPDGKKLVIGRGSKLLFSDAGYDGTVIVMRMERIRFLDYVGQKSGIIEGGVRGSCGRAGVCAPAKMFGCGDECSDEFRIYAEAGVSLPFLSRLACERALSGLEWAGGIPGTVGGAVKMNAGAFGGDMSQIIDYVDVLRGGRVVGVCPADCGFGYRRSSFYKDDIIIGAMIRLSRGRTRNDGMSEVKLRQDENRLKRAAAQPSGFSCGSVFKAALKDGGQVSAWSLIDSCGLRGLSMGAAQISQKHANFFINNGGARASDILTLIRTAKAEGYLRSGLRLNEEVIPAGDF